MWNKKLLGTGGFLFIIITLLTAFSLQVGVELAKSSISRSVAKNVSQTIALECLASCYTNDPKAVQSGENSTRTFDRISLKQSDIDPLKEFNSIMKQYHMMNENGSATSFTYEYNPGEPVYRGGVKVSISRPTFSIKFNEYKAIDGWNNMSVISPDQVSVVIEER